MLTYSTRIIDAAGDRRLPGSSLGSLENTPFNRFVAAVSQHVVAATGRSNADLVFVFWPLIDASNGPLDADLRLEGPQPSDASRLESPWVRLTLPRSPDRLVAARFIWNERQFLLDQAAMSGARAEPGELLAPMNEQVFAQLADDYARCVLLASSPEAAAEAVTAISKRIPPDMLWLFQHAWQSTRGPFTELARAALADTIGRAGPRYIELTKLLFDRCLASDAAEQRYASILDLADLIAFDRYRISSLH